MTTLRSRLCKLFPSALLVAALAVGTNEALLAANGMPTDAYAPDCNVTFLRSGDRLAVFDVGAGAIEQSGAEAGKHPGAAVCVRAAADAQHNAGAAGVKRVADQFTGAETGRFAGPQHSPGENGKAGRERHLDHRRALVAAGLRPQPRRLRLTHGGQ